MIGIDTNILVRYLVEDDPVQTDMARRFLDNTCSKETPGFINQIVLSEIVWLLQRGYRYDKEAIVQTVKRLLKATDLIVEEATIVLAALRDFESGNAGFVDYLIAHQNRASGCSHTVTFDRKASRHRLFERLSG